MTGPLDLVRANALVALLVAAATAATARAALGGAGLLGPGRTRTALNAAALATVLWTFAAGFLAAERLGRGR